MPTATLESPAAREKTRATIESVIRRYPRLTAHLICKSLGYFCPRSAANAVAHHINGEPYFCEWYYDWASKMGGPLDQANRQPFEDRLREVGNLAITYAASQRHHHQGYMAEYSQALQLVMAERQAAGCTSGMLASWF